MKRVLYRLRRTLYTSNLQHLQQYRDRARPVFQRLGYAAVLGGAVLLALRSTPSLLEVPALGWAVGVATVAFLAPYPARWLLITVIASGMTMVSIPIAVLVALGGLLAIAMAPEDGADTPVQFGLLTGVPMVTTGFALVPLAAGVALGAKSGWKVGLLQSMTLATFISATATFLPPMHVPTSAQSSTTELSVDQALIKEGSSEPIGIQSTPPATDTTSVPTLSTGVDNQIQQKGVHENLGQIWVQSLAPWMASIISQPGPFLRLIALWTLAGLIGGKVVAVTNSVPLRLLAPLVAPLVVALGFGVIENTPLNMESLLLTGFIAVGFGSLGSMIAALYAPATKREIQSMPITIGIETQEPKTPTSRIRPAKWDDIAGYDDVKREIREALEPLTNEALRKRLQAAGIDPSKGVLLYGPPGTGKTLLARAAASELGLGFVLVSGPEVLNMYVGNSEAAIRNAFQQARSIAPAILFFDELEALVPPRTTSSGSMGGVYRTVVATFLGLMDGVRDLGRVVVIAATNAPEQIDSAMLRPGRFDRVIYVAAPDPLTRKLILERFLEGKPGAENIDVEVLIRPTERFTGADLTGLVRRAYEATKGNPITTDQLLTLANATRPTVTLAMLEQYDALAETFGRSSGAMREMVAAPRPKLTWDDVGGLEQAKHALREAVMLPLEYPDIVEKFGVRPSKGVLLYGPPGTGKTLLARVVADQARATFLSASGSELAGIGGPQSIRRLFARAREAAPTVVFIDEIDAIGSRESSMIGGTAVHQLLVEMDGVKPSEGLIVLAATNRPDDLDPAILRPGRFDAKVEIGLPDEAGRKAIFRLHLLGKPGAEMVDLDQLAQSTEGISAAEIAGAVNAATRRVAMGAALSDQSAPDSTLNTELLLLELQSRG